MKVTNILYLIAAATYLLFMEQLSGYSGAAAKVLPILLLMLIVLLAVPKNVYKRVQD